MGVRFAFRSSALRCLLSFSNTEWNRSDCSGKRDSHHSFPSGGLFVNQRYKNILEDPPRVTSLLLNDGADDQLIQQGASISLTCSWDAGNPPVYNVSFISQSGNFHSPATTEGIDSVVYTIHNVSCVDLGKVRCEVPGADVNGTTRLLVKCPPQFVTSVPIPPVKSGQHLVLQFPFRSHTSNVTTCFHQDVSHVPDHPATNNTTLQCSSRVRYRSVKGTPPDFVLTVGLDKVTSQDQGQWTLTLTNDEGSVQMVFHVNVTEKTQTTPNVKVKSTSKGIHWSLLLPAVIAPFVVVVGLAALIYVCKHTKRRRTVRRATQAVEMNENDPDEAEQVELRRLSGSSGGHVYEEVRGSNVSHSEDVPRPDRRLSPRVGSDGYMVPAPLTTSTRHTDATDQDSPPAASGAYMDMGQGSGAGGYVDMSQGQRSNQDQRPVDITTTAAQERNVNPVYENTT